MAIYLIRVYLPNIMMLHYREGTLLEFPIIQENRGFTSKRRRLRNENLKIPRDYVGDGGEATVPNTKIPTLFHGHSQETE